MATFFDPSTIAGWFDDGQVLRAYLGDRSRLADVNVRYLLESNADSITAFATGGQTNATPLGAELNRVTTVATAADSVKLPASQAGLTIIVENAGASAMQVFGAGTDTVNGVATATGVSQM